MSTSENKGRLRVALATCREIPEVDHDEPILLRALRDLNVDVEMIAWDDPIAVWVGLDACVVRSTWNYYRDHRGFLDWVDRVATARVPMWNPPEIIRWNSHKKYLTDLAEQGFTVVPTEPLARGSSHRLAEILARRKWTHAVVKPAVSAGSFRTTLVVSPVTDEVEREFQSLLAERDVLVQPFVSSVTTYGERSLIWIDGSVTHSVRKSPRFGTDSEQVSPVGDIAEDERRLAERVVAALGTKLLYARVDMARDDAGALMIMELELIEPSLFLVQSEVALDRFARAIAHRAEVTAASRG